MSSGTYQRRSTPKITATRGCRVDATSPEMEESEVGEGGTTVGDETGTERVGDGEREAGKGGGGVDGEGSR